MRHKGNINRTVKNTIGLKCSKHQGVGSSKAKERSLLCKVPTEKSGKWLLSRSKLRHATFAKEIKYPGREKGVTYGKLPPVCYLVKNGSSVPGLWLNGLLCMAEAASRSLGNDENGKGRQARRFPRTQKSLETPCCCCMILEETTEARKGQT